MTETFSCIILPVANVLIVAAPFVIAGLLGWAFAGRFIERQSGNKGD